ncbi:nitric oxide reductase activation protein NorD [Variovorax sp. RHLX14]|uniref:nitric oxide reductase activation protein NorD n=1 Tax=Variovorax sp. RHLX14 TaxID=1259731 RepID=UPI003F464E96
MPRSELAPLGPYLRLLWNVAPPLLLLPAAIEGDAGDAQPYLSHAGLHLPAAPAAPAAPAGLDGASAAHWQRAAAAHAAAHLVFSRSVFVREGMAPITQALLGLLEDARAEALACRQLPGLRRLWAPLHTVTSQDGDDFETLMLRLARGLIDASYVDPHPWIAKGRSMFFSDGSGQEVLAQTAPRALRQLASALGNDIGQMRIGFNPKLYRPGPSYRDDNRWLWHSDEQHAGRSQPAPTAARLKDDATGDIPPEPVQWRYPEWDRRIGRERRDWCAVIEHAASESASAVRWSSPSSSPSIPFPAARLRAALQVAALRTRVLQPREADGDELDVENSVQTLAALRRRQPWDERVYRRIRHAPARLAVMLLLDTSASSGERPLHASAAGSATTVLSLAQCAAAELAAAMSRLGWRVAIQGFSSDGRHAVRHSRVLGFGQPWNDAAERRLAGLRAGDSTRIGAALRHATRALLEQPATRRIALVLGDGEAYDIDVHEPGYLTEDARHAVRTARRAGVRCLCLMPGTGSPEAARIFGPDGIALLRDMSSLPLAMSRLLSSG